MYVLIEAPLDEEQTVHVPVYAVVGVPDDVAIATIVEMYQQVYGDVTCRGKAVSRKVLEHASLTRVAAATWAQFEQLCRFPTSLDAQGTGLSQVMLRMPVVLHNALVTTARMNRTSLNKYCNKVLQAHLTNLSQTEESAA